MRELPVTHSCTTKEVQATHGASLFTYSHGYVFYQRAAEQLRTDEHLLANTVDISLKSNNVRVVKKFCSRREGSYSLLA